MYRSAFERLPAVCGSLGVLALSSRGVVRASCFYHPLPTLEIMKRVKYGGLAKKKTNKVEEKSAEAAEKPAIKADSLDDEDQGFGGWLRSPDGLETMKLFVIANSVVMLTTLIYPQVQTAFQTVSDMIYGPDTLFDYGTH